MKNTRLFMLLAAFLFTACMVQAQADGATATFAVNGNCGMCKSTIEKSAKAAGATVALWDEKSKMITVKYNVAATNNVKIQKAIAKSGYDNAGFKAADEDYKKLHGCCQYNRAETGFAQAKSEASCSGKADAASCEKGAKGEKKACTKTKKCCKDK